MPVKNNLVGTFKKFVYAIKSRTWRTLIGPLLPSSPRIKRRSPETLTVYPPNADEGYLPEYDWNVHDREEGERYASLADLCTHVGGQLPTQVVKLIARDVLRELEHLHEARGVAHSGTLPLPFYCVMYIIHVSLSCMWIWKTSTPIILFFRPAT